MGDSSGMVYSFGQAVGGAMIALWVIIICVAIIAIALLVWFIYVMTKIKGECTRTNKLLADVLKRLGQGAINGGGASVSVSDELAKYKGLLDDGAITEEEYNLKKIQLLNK